MLILKTSKDKNIFSKLNFINEKKVERFSFKNKNDINKQLKILINMNILLKM